MPRLLAIDQGTTSSRAILFDTDLRPLATAQLEFAQHFPEPGQVEHAPEDLLSSVVTCVRDVLAKSGTTARDIAAIGITNQRETTLVWERASGKAVHPAIVWQDRRTAETCAGLRAAGHEELVRARTGLLLDPYFSATKLAHILDVTPNGRARAARGELLFGTVDSFLIWHLTGGRVHATDATNAARTMLYDIGAGRWDPDLCAMLDIPMAMLPEVKDCADDFGQTAPDLFGAAIPIAGVAGDQQAATIGQACFAPGMMKSTFGTGCFALLNTGDKRLTSAHRLLTTIAYRLDGKVTYALEGSIFIAGAVVQWLRDGLKLLARAEDVNALAAQADPRSGVIIVPAFTGLGAPWWNAECRGAVFGITRATSAAEMARAAIESVGFQMADLLAAMRADVGVLDQAILRVDGGMARSDTVLQFLADITGAVVDRPVVTETTALGAAYLAGLKVGLCPAPAEFAKSWALERRFTPDMPASLRSDRLARWHRAVHATLSV